MLRSYRLGRILGFPIDVNLTFLLLLGAVLLWMGGLAGVFVVLLAFGSVLLHELGHAVVARSLGVPISGIELHFFGGAAKMMAQPKTANHEILIAAAGPAVSLVLAGIGLGFGVLTGVELIALLGWINLIIAAFNLVPALPMDGGRILRAVLTRWFHFEQATAISVKIARGFSILLGVAGLAIGSVQYVLLAVVLWFFGSAELRMARQFGGRYAYDAGGYRERDGGDVEVLPRGFAQRGREQQEPSTGSERRSAPPTWMGPGRFVIHRRNGRVVIEFVN